MFTARMCAARASLVVSLLNMASVLAAGESHLIGFPSLHDITGSAVYLYDDMGSVLDSYIFYPDLKFTCLGSIRRITFVGERRQTERNVEKYLRFSTWISKSDEADFYLNRTKVKTLNFNVSAASILINGAGNLSLYRVELRGDDEFIFEDGDVFGIRQSDSSRSKVAVIHQIGGGNAFTTEVSSSNFHTRHFMIDRLSKRSYVPLIAIDAGQNSSCVQGFLSEQMLEMITNATLEQTPQVTTIAQPNNSSEGSELRLFVNMTVATTGTLTKWTFAAKFHHDRGKDGWPELQIWRKSGESSYNKIAGTRTEPKPTGYLNVYEYDLTKLEQTIEVMAGDVLGVYQSDVQESQFSLQFLATSGSAPTNYIIHGPEVDEVNVVDVQHSSYEEMAPVPMVYAQIEAAPPTTTVSTASPQPGSSTTSSLMKPTLLSPGRQEDRSADTLTVIVVATAVALGMLVLMVVVAVVILAVVVVRRAKLVKRVDLLGNHSQMENPSYVIEDEMKSRYYLTRGESAGPSEMMFIDSFEDTASETYHFYHSLNPSDGKNIITGLAIPDYSEVELRDVRIYTTPERDSPTPSNQRRSTSTPAQQVYDRTSEWRKETLTTRPNCDRANMASMSTEQLYATLGGEELYSEVHDGDSTTADSRPFFEETESFWRPATDYASLYQQLANKKYREILRNQIQLNNFIGSGHFGTVMKGEWLLPGGSKEVAIKTLKEGSSEQDKVKFLQEAAINGQFWHPNVVRLMGVVTVGEPVMIVLELLPNGDLRDYLCKTVSTNILSDTPQTLLRFCKDISSGMKYLAGKNFVHRDLAARNILVSEDTTCKISDFGMSRDLEDENYYVSHGGKIPVKWTAPEAIHYKKYSTASDVWSFGCVMFEIWTLGKKPFKGYTNPETVRMVDMGYRLPPPPGCPRELYRLMIECWHPDKSHRPTFEQLQEILTDFPLIVTDTRLLGATLETSTQDDTSNTLQTTYATETLYDYR